MNIEVNEKAIRTLFSDDFWFNIPSYQRPYVWGKDNITDLLDDIVYAFKYNTQDKYFLGYLFYLMLSSFSISAIFFKILSLYFLKATKSSSLLLLNIQIFPL